MLGGVARHMLPHLSGVPHHHVSRPLKDGFYVSEGKCVQVKISAQR